MKTTEQLVRECFCPNKLLDKNDRFVRELWKLPRSNKDVLYLARAARHFVKMEQQQMSVDKLDDEIQRLMHLANSKERKRR